MRVFASIAGCLRCSRGAAMTEFILIVPMMVLMLTGVVEVAGLLQLDRKLQNAAYATADLSTQNPSLNDTRLADIFAAANLVLQPYIDTGLSVGIASVVFDADTGAASVDWTESLRGGTVPDAATLAVGMGGPGESVVVVRANYTYVPLFGDFVIPGVPLEETAFARPRRSLKVTRE
jgi:Flp pilus assembly protein TadG